MEYSRRRLLQTTGLAAAAAGLVGRNGRSNDETATAAETNSETGVAAETTTENAESPVSVDAAVAVVTEWNTVRARLYDTVALAATGRLGAAAYVTGDALTRFEQSSGEWGVHEQLEATNEQNYETFESRLGGAREAYAAGDAERGSDPVVQAADNLLAAQRGRVDVVTINALEILLLGVCARDAGLFAAAGEADAAAELTNAVYEDFEDAPAHSSLEFASGELYETFEAVVEGTADVGDAETIAASVRTAADAMVDVSYELASEAVAGASHLVFMRAVGFDAEVFAGFGGPGDKFAYTAALSLYRVRAADVPRLVAAGEAGLAATVASDVLVHSEGARAHGVLEEADHGAHEGLEGGLESSTEAAKSGDGAAAEETVATVDENLPTGISAPVSGGAATVLEAAFFRARLGDACELVVAGEMDRAAAVGEFLFARSEKNEANLHESVGEEPEEPYHRFEEEYLAGLVEDAAAGNADAIAAYAEGAMDVPFEFEAAVGVIAEVSAAKVAFFGARGFDAVALAQASAPARAGSVVQFTFVFFESGTGGYRKTSEEAGHDLYELFEGVLGLVRIAAEKGGDAYGAAKIYGQKAVDSMYAVVATAAVDADLGVVASERMIGAFQILEEARVHEALEGVDRDVYESFKVALSDYVDALADGSGVDAAAEVYAMATVCAQFAVVGEVGKVPETGSSRDGGSVDAALSDGSNVVEGVPEDADHVVEMSAVAFESAELTILAGDTIAFEHVDGEAHSVTAYGDELLKGVVCWASDGFES